MRARLDESPERDIDIVTGAQVTETGDRVPVINAATGTAQEILHVDNTAGGGGDGSKETPFNTLAAAQAAASAQTIIYVKQGDGLTTGQDQGITLNKTGQQLIGSGTNFVWDSGVFRTANGRSPTSLLIAAATSAPKITNVNALSDGITISANDVMVAGVTVDGATRDGIVIEADGAAASATGVTIQNVSAINNRFGIYVHGANGGAIGAKVQGAVTTTNSQHGVAIYDDTSGSFTADLGGGSLGSTGGNVLAGNTLEDLAVELDGGTLMAQNNWWGQASGPDTDDPSVGIAPQIYYGAPINDGLVGHWTFDSEWTTNTTAYDRSGQGNNGTLNGGLSLADQVAGQNRQALDFDGTADNIQTGNIDLSGTNAVTAIIWRKIDAYLNNGPTGTAEVELEFASNFNGTSEGFIVSIDEGTVCNARSTFGLRGNVGYAAFCYARPSLSAYHHITTVLDKGRVTDEVDLYIDSVLQVPVAKPFNSNNTNNFGNLPLNIMSRNDTGLFGEDAADDVRIYNRALSAPEISELYRMDTSSAVNTSGFLTAAP